MEELFFAVIFLGVPLICVVGLVVLVRAILQKSDLEKRATALEDEVKLLRLHGAQAVDRLAALEAWANARLEAEQRAREEGRATGFLPAPMPVPETVQETVQETVPETVPEAVQETAPAAAEAVEAAPVARPAPLSAAAEGAGAAPHEAQAPPQAAPQAAPTVAAAQPAAGAQQAPAGTPPQQAAGGGGHPPIAAAARGGADGPPPAVPESKPAISWEQWLGVRGAAAAGALVLVIAGLYFFKYSVDHGLLTTTLRVILGTGLGVGCVIASELPLRKRYAVLADWVGGAGVAILYLSFWAAAALYDLIPVTAGFALMAAVTALACVLSVRHRALPIALLGLLGGFATPTLLSTGSDRPIALFSYLLLLDGALLFVAHRRRWPALALLGLGGTTLYQLVWIFSSMGPERIFLGIAILAVFGVLFALVPVGRDGEGKSAQSSPVMRLTRALAVLAPFAFALFFASNAELGPWFYPTGGLLLMLSAGALYVGHKEGLPVLGLAAAAASVGVLAVFLLGHRPDTLLGALEVVGFGALLAGLFHIALERDPTRSMESNLAALVTTAGPLGLTALAAVSTPTVSLYPWLAGWALSSALLYRQGALPGRSFLVAAAPVATALALALYTVGRDFLAGLRLGETEVAGPPVTTLLAVLLLALTAISFVPRLVPERLRHHATIGAIASVLIVFLAFGISPESASLPVIALVAGPLLFQLVGSLNAARLDGRWLFALHFVTAIVLTLVAWGDPRIDGEQGALIFAGCAAAFVLATASPHLSPRLLRDPWGHRAAAVAGPLFFLAIYHSFDVAFGDRAIGALPLGLGAIALGGLVVSKTALPAGAAARRVSLVWLSAVVAGFVTLAIPLQLDREWITVAWALEGAALLGLYLRLEHPGLKYIALALLAVVTVRLVANPYLLDYHLRAELPGVVWLTYTFLVPAACLIAAHFILWRNEPRLMRPWERSIIKPEHRLAARATAISAIVVIFVYLNLIIFDLYGTGPSLTIPTDHLMARDLTTSMVWALYGLGLLGLGVGVRSTGLRAMSLALFLLTAAKVFLYDLSHLEDLYRVASLVGLAMSLIIVSLAYQRFVFRSPAKGEVK